MADMRLERLLKSFLEKVIGEVRYVLRSKEDLK